MTAHCLQTLARCVYSSVIVISLWAISSFTAGKSTPAITRWLAKVCQKYRTWNFKPGLAHSQFACWAERAVREYLCGGRRLPYLPAYSF